MTLDRSYLLPISLSVFFHAGLLIWLGGDWFSPAPKKMVPPTYVSAKLVELKPKTVVSAPKAAAPAKKPVNKVDVEAKRRAAELQKQKAEKQRQLEAQRKVAEQKEKQRKAAEAKAREEALAEKRRQEEKAAEAERQKQKQQAFAEALAEEQAMLAEQQAEATAQSYVAVIQDKIVRNWSRPPSARNGMVCWLRIQLIPSGEVVNVTITKSSGNEAFDRSAEQAVRLAGRFEVLRDVAPDVFEKYFRQLSIKFDPKDLRL